MIDKEDDITASDLRKLEACTKIKCDVSDAGTRLDFAFEHVMAEDYETAAMCFEHVAQRLKEVSEE